MKTTSVKKRPLFDELLGVIQGRIEPGSVTTFHDNPDGTVKAVRHKGEAARKIMEEMHLANLAARSTELKDTRQKLDMTQDQFARVLGVSTRTLQQWEQRRREPSASAKVLLAIAKKHPRIVKKAAAELALT